MTDADEPPYAVGIANASFSWYHKAAVKSRRLNRSTEIIVIAASALIPLATVLFPDHAELPAILGSIVAIVAGMRASFHWHENHLRFSRAREAIEAERRKFYTRTPPYDTDDSDREPPRC